MEYLVTRLQLLWYKVAKDRGVSYSGMECPGFSYIWLLH